MNKPIPITTQLSSIFPDIEDELCSRHSILFGKLKNTFNKIYDHMEPSHYIMVKGLLNTYDQNDVKLSLALQNGVILMCRQIDKQAPLYFNGNHFDEQTIMTFDGKIDQGINPFADEFAIVIKAATKEIDQKQLYGGIFYLHCNIPQDQFEYKKILLMNVFIGVALINKNLDKYTLQQLIQRMASCKVMGDEQSIRKHFQFTNRQFVLQVGESKFTIPFQKKDKMILCQLDLAKRDIQYQINRKRNLQARKNQILSICKDKCGLDTILKIYFQDEDKLKLTFEDQIQNQQDPILDADKYLDISLKELGLFSQFNNGNITFEQLVSAQWELNSKYWKIHSDQVVQLVEDIKQALKINSCMIICQSFILIVADKNKYSELLLYLRQKLHKGELKSKSLFKIEEQLIQHRWSSDKIIGQKMFTSIPSCGVSIYDPKEAIWFD